MDTLSFDLSVENVENSVSEMNFNYSAGDQRFEIGRYNLGGYRVSGPGAYDADVTLFRCYAIRDSYPHVLQLFFPTPNAFCKSIP